MIYIDKSENRSTSKLPTYLPPEKQGLYKFVTGLESVSGADLLISPSNNLPDPTTLPLIKLHLNDGAELVQLKFDLDLPASIIDGRYKDAQSKMKEIGAAPWQRTLLFIGVAKKATNSDLLTMNNQQVRGSSNFQYRHLNKHKKLWCARGGAFYELPSGKHIWEWLEDSEQLLRLYKESNQKTVWPKSPVLYKEELEQCDNTSWLELEYQTAQKLTRIKDLRNLIITLPGIGDTLTQEIWEFLDDKSIYGLLDVLRSGALTQIKGVGPASIKKINQFLGVNDSE